MSYLDERVRLRRTLVSDWKQKRMPLSLFCIPYIFGSTVSWSNGGNRLYTEVDLFFL